MLSIFKTKKILHCEIVLFVFLYENNSANLIKNNISCILRWNLVI
jgi:hypothetical protein